MSENLLSRLEQSLRQSRAARMHLAARLRELRPRLTAFEPNWPRWTPWRARRKPRFTVCSRRFWRQGNISLGLPSDAELEAAMRQSQPACDRKFLNVATNSNSPQQRRSTQRSIYGPHHPAGSDTVASRGRWTTHVNEIYNRLLEGGFKFTGQNPTISVAVSLNRNTRFRKVAPGTFDLVMRDASKAS